MRLQSHYNGACQSFILYCLPKHLNLQLSLKHRTDKMHSIYRACMYVWDGFVHYYTFSTCSSTHTHAVFFQTAWVCFCTVHHYTPIPIRTSVSYLLHYMLGKARPINHFHLSLYISQCDIFVMLIKCIIKDRFFLHNQV